MLLKELNMELFEKIITERGIRPTALRLLILKYLYEQSSALSLTDIELLLDTVDKSTISRTLTLFLKHKLIHSIDDGTGSTKYSLCNTSCNCVVNDLHVHFHCYSCDKTYCLENIAIPSISLPKDFSVESANFVMKGLCSSCKRKK